MNFYKEIKDDFFKFCDALGVPSFHLERQTDAKVSIRFDFGTVDVESFDDDVDVVRADFLVNLYAPKGEFSKWNDKFENAIRDFSVFDFILIGTEREGGVFNTAFNFSKFYFRR